MQHPHDSLDASASHSLLRAQARLGRTALGLLGVLGSLLGACGPAPWDQLEDEDSSAASSTYTSTSSSPASSYSSPKPQSTSSSSSTATTTSKPSTNASNAPMQSAATASNSKPMQSAASANSSSQANVCGSNCSNEPYVKTEITRCGSGPTQGPCYCAAALVYLCFMMEECYAEAGEDTDVTYDTLADGLIDSVQKDENLGYDCKFVADDGQIILNDALSDVITPSTPKPAAQAQNDAQPAPAPTPAPASSGGCGGTCPAGKVCACPAR